MTIHLHIEPAAKRYGHALARGFAAATIAASALMAAPVAQAQDAGKQEFAFNCATCHGESGRGDGEMARFLNVPTPDLTALSKGNDGEFPLLRVIHIIDGREGLGPHGTMMPIWGERFTASAVAETGIYGAEVIARGRILSLAMYLESIQQ